tara:strand:- start:5353 stop:6666 length:1314 start_codon:yes stop_codon:yes gene_type:complete
MDTKNHLCPVCSNALGVGIHFDKLDSKICRKCFAESQLCYECEKIVLSPDCHTAQNQTYCEECFHEFCFSCEGCGDSHHIDDCVNSEQGMCYCDDCYNDIFSSCVECDYELYTEDANYSESQEGYFCDDCYMENSHVEFESEYDTTVNPINNEDSFSINRFERAVGVEIETTGSSADEIRNNEVFSQFRVTYDGSIDGDSDNEGFEFISKPMRGDYLFQEIDKIGSHLLENDFRVNKTCGLHVHIDARDLFYDSLKGIAIVMKSFENVVFSMMPESRQTKRWCKPMSIDKNDLIQISSDEEFINTWYDSCGETPSMDKYNDARYYGLNLHARVFLGTIEFRYHSGTNNPTKIKNWITICQSIVEKGIVLGKVMDEVPSQWDSKTHKLMTQDNLGLIDFIEILELDSIGQYIVERVSKFNRFINDDDREYAINYNTSV